MRQQDRKPKPDLSSLVYGKVPPQAVNLEEAVLAAAMTDRDRLDEIFGIIKSPDCFYVDAHQKVYAAIVRISTRGGYVDMLTVAEELKKAGELESVGGHYFIAQLTTKGGLPSKVESHCRIVMEKYFAREVIRICGAAISMAYEDSEDVFDVLREAQVGLSGIVDNIQNGKTKHISQTLIDTIKAMHEAREQTSDMLGFETGLKKLDEITLGFTAPDFIILAAGTGEGKTTAALNIALHMSSKSIPALFFSLEMKDRQLVWKVISSKIEEDIKTIRLGKFSQEKWQHLEGKVFNDLSSYPFYIYDQGGITIVELKAIARNEHKRHGIKAVFIDYIQLVRGAGKKFGTREEEVNYVSKELKSLAMELEIPVIALSQLSRAEKGGMKRTYQLSDLRESGALEQDADGVIFIFRPHKHNMPSILLNGQETACNERDSLFLIEKWRLGETGMFRTLFDGKYNKFSDYTDPNHFIPEQPYSPAISSHYRNNPVNGYQPEREIPGKYFDDDTPF